MRSGCSRSGTIWEPPGARAPRKAVGPRPDRQTRAPDRTQAGVRNDPESFQEMAALMDAEAAQLERDAMDDIGSNNWVVSGDLTQDGYPMMVNDPHRTQAVPSLRYWVHLVGPGMASTFTGDRMDSSRRGAGMVVRRPAGADASHGVGESVRGRSAVGYRQVSRRRSAGRLFGRGGSRR